MAWLPGCIGMHYQASRRRAYSLCRNDLSYSVEDTVHVASRLEGLVKGYHCQMALSEQVAIL